MKLWPLALFCQPSVIARVHSLGLNSADFLSSNFCFGCNSFIISRGCNNFLPNFQEDNFPFSHSTYLVDSPTSVPYNVTNIQTSSSTAPLCSHIDDDNSLPLYGAVHKTGPNNRHSASAEEFSYDAQRNLNFEDSESDYASELRRQTYRQKLGNPLF